MPFSTERLYCFYWSVSQYAIDFSTHDFKTRGLGLGQAQTHGGVRSVNGIISSPKAKHTYKEDKKPAQNRFHSKRTKQTWTVK